jgi:tetratricopeptide (TPR) repeat protein
MDVNAAAQATSAMPKGLKSLSGSLLDVFSSRYIRRATLAYQADRLLEAESICHRLIQQRRNLFDAHHLLAVIQARTEKRELALINYNKALEIRPDSVEALFNRGWILLQFKRFDEALESYDRALEIRSDYAEAYCARGIALHAMRRFEEALSSYDRALELRLVYPEALANRGNTLKVLKRYEEALASYDGALNSQASAELHFNRGVILGELKRYEEAASSYQQAVSIRPNYPDAILNRGNVLHALGRFEQALNSYDQVLALHPNHAEALTNRGGTLHELKRHAEALTSFDRALLARPGSAKALSNRGWTLHELGRFAEALESYNRAIMNQPDLVEALSNRGLTFLEFDRFEEALASLDKAIDIRPDYAEAFSNRGNVLLQLSRFDEALASYSRAQEIRPSLADAHWNEAMVRLLIGDFNKGWIKHEWRWMKEPLIRARRNFPQPCWLGSQSIAGKTVLLHSEQGLGDTIQFSRYASLVADMEAQVILEVDSVLESIMKTLRGPAKVLGKGNALPHFDFHCPLHSLPLAFGTSIASIPAPSPYLSAPPPQLMDWSTELGAKNNIGLVWEGNPLHKNDRRRSIALRELLPLFDLDAKFVSLQKNVPRGDLEVLRKYNVVHLGDRFESFGDTAAVISNLDLVLSVDTSVAHLAGALGKPVWVMLPFIPDWRWLLGRDDTPWYPTARLFRQSTARRWDAVIADVRSALTVFLQRHVQQ